MFILQVGFLHKMLDYNDHASLVLYHLGNLTLNSLKPISLDILNTGKAIAQCVTIDSLYVFVLISYIFFACIVHWRAENKTLAKVGIS